MRLENIPFNGARAYDYLKQLCDLGPRRSGSEAMVAQQKFLAEHFEKLGAKVEFQRFKAPYPLDGPDEQMIGHDVPMANIIVRFNPENRERIMLCGHYDTLPFPLHDPVDRRGRFVGANDNGSGMAILMELGNELAKNPPKVGVDFVFFDGEEFIFADDGKYFLRLGALCRRLCRSTRRPSVIVMPCCWTWSAARNCGCPRSPTA